MKLLTKSLYHLRCELRVQGINLAGLTRGKVDDQERYDGDEEKGDDLLYDASTNKGQHVQYLQPVEFLGFIGSVGLSPVSFRSSNPINTSNPINIITLQGQSQEALRVLSTC